MQKPQPHSQTRDANLFVLEARPRQWQSIDQFVSVLPPSQHMQYLKISSQLVVNNELDRLCDIFGQIEAYPYFDLHRWLLQDWLAEPEYDETVLFSAAVYTAYVSVIVEMRFPSMKTQLPGAIIVSLLM